MSDNAVSQSLSSWTPAIDVVRFSPHPNQAHKIHWHSWSEAAFQEAMQTDKPILLIISSTWCRWCHLMDETTLSEPSIINIINHDYIPIRVDGDIRPDINQRYNQNGWPSIALLSAEGEILWGGVYVPPRQMLYYLGYIRRYYSEHRQEIARQIKALQEQRTTRQFTQTLSHNGGRSLLQEERRTLVNLPNEAGNVLRELYDPNFGGFNIHPHLKFPHPEALELLLLLAQQGQTDALTLVRYSLEQMRDGGLWDKEAGGFFRYSAASDWGMPHTEKMLDENAAMLRFILLTAHYTKEQQWYDLARHLLLYINTTLWQPEIGVFSGSQSADEEYYEPGPYSRASRVAPPIDTTIYTSWNARMISSYLLASQVLAQPSLQMMALRALDWLCEHMIHQDGSVYHYAIRKHAGLPGQLSDQVWLTCALLDAYELHPRKRYLETAIALMHFVCQELFDRQSDLFFDYPERPPMVGRLALREQSLIDNALAAECLLRMAAYSKRKHLRDTGLQVLVGCLEKYRRTGIQGAIYTNVVMRAIENGWV
jgi:uncharacterized protein YyaL (SSP411 family)